MLARENLIALKDYDYFVKARAGKENVKRQHMGALQHNKTIVVDGPKVQAAVCGSTNFSWRGLYVQNNNAVVVYGEKAIQPFLEAFLLGKKNPNRAIPE